MGVITTLALRTASTHRRRYVLGTSAVAVAAGFLSASDLVTRALSDGMRSAGANDDNAKGLFALLAVFGLIAAVASGFVIANSFATMLAARARELALLRAVGARRKQIRATVLIEGTAVGVVGGLIGLAAGTALAWLIVALAIDDAGLPLPSASTMLIALGVSLGVTWASVLSASRRATRVPPVAAMGQAQVLEALPLGRNRIIGGWLLIAVGLGFVAIPGEDLVNVLAFVVGGLLVFAGLSTLAAGFVPWVARLLGRLAGTGPAARLAVGNLERSRRRVANTAMAVTLGITLFTGSVVILSSATAQAEANGYTQDNSGAMYAMAFALTGMTVVVGLVGVINTLVLSVQERIRELALLRAVGMTSGEVRRTVTIEGALLGAVGVLLGLVFGLAAGRILLLRVDHTMPMVPPWLIVIGMAVGCLAIVVGVSFQVGRRPSRQSPVAALAAV